MKDELIKFETFRMAEDKGYWTSLDDESRRRLRGKLPTQSLLQRWLREVHKIYVCMEPHSVGPGAHSWWLSKPQHFYKLSNVHELEHPYEFWSYEEALEKGLQAALKLIPDTKSTT